MVIPIWEKNKYSKSVECEGDLIVLKVSKGPDFFYIKLSNSLILSGVVRFKCTNCELWIGGTL